MKYFLRAFAMVVIFCIPSLAEEATFSFRGIIHEMDGQYNYFTGQSFELTFSFDPATADENPADPETGSYVGAIRSGSFTIFNRGEPMTWIVDPDGTQNIIEVKNGETMDSYLATVSIHGPVGGSEIPADFMVELIDNNATALSSDALPLSLDIQAFEYQQGVKLSFVGVRQLVFATVGVINSADLPQASGPD
ncbi:MAG: hypothetical protein P8Z37_14295 [Acidobacteriota bacterium]